LWPHSCPLCEKLLTFYLVVVIGIHTPEEYLTLSSGPSDWLIKPLIPSGGRAIIASAAKAGKSSFGLQMALSIVEGQPFLNYGTPKAQSVLYCQVDNPRTLWQERFAMIQQVRSLSTAVKFGILDKEDLPYPFNILEIGHCQALRAYVDEWQPGLVIIDTLRESFRGDENDSDVLQRVFSSFTVACRPAAILFIHHSKKPSTGKDATPHALLDSGRGSSYIPGAVDTFLSIKGYKPHTDKVTGEIIRKGTLSVQGRAISESETKLVQDQVTYLWRLPEATTDPFSDAVTAIIHDVEYESDVKRADALHQSFPQKTVEACRHAIRRARG
jgi:RecA-family ATPase